MAKEMLINTVAGQECRIAITQDGRLEELYIERASSASHVGNIYKARITNVEPSIQAAFVDFGLSKNGFLHISDVHPKYFPSGDEGTSEQVGRKRPHHHRPPIQECFRRGQEVVVQMTKEGIGTKGPTMTTYLSIPGRLLVMMPRMARLGVSRKVEDPEARSRTRAALDELKLPPDMGFIVRTAGVGRSKRDLQRDLNYLTRLWKSVKQRIAGSKAPAEIYQESDLVTRTIRDVYNTDITRLICDQQSTARKVQEFLAVAMPRTKHNIELYAGKEGLFHDGGLEDEIERIYSHRVELRSGGSLVIDQTEALVAIDVNSGRFREHSDAETTALKINQEAAKEIARQLRLRDLGGVIIIDFIDMREEKNRRAVEKSLRDAMKPDRAKAKVLKISNFGIVEMTRQRMRPSLKDSMYRPCAFCEGAGRIKSEESQALQVIRDLQRASANDDVLSIEVAVTPPVAHHLTNFHRAEIVELEARTGKTVIIRADASLRGDEVTLRCTNSRGSEVAWARNPLAERGKMDIRTVPVEELKLPPGAELEDEEGELLAEEFEDFDELASDEGEEAVGAAPTDRQPAPRPAAAGVAAPAAGEAKKSRRRGRRGGRKHRKRGGGQPGAAEHAGAPEADETPHAATERPAGEAQAVTPEHPQPSEGAGEHAEGEQHPARKKSRRRRRGGRSRGAGEPAPAGQPSEAAEGHAEHGLPHAPQEPVAPAEQAPMVESEHPADGSEMKVKKSRHRRRGGRSRAAGEAAPAGQLFEATEGHAEHAVQHAPQEPAAPAEQAPAAENEHPAGGAEMKAKKPRRRRHKKAVAGGERAEGEGAEHEAAGGSQESE